MHALCLLLCSVFLLSGTLPDPEDRVFSQQGEKIDSFLIRTAKRISDAWTLCWEEFRLSSESACHESSDFIRSEVEKQTDSAIRQVKEKASEAVEDRIRKLIPGSGPDASEPLPLTDRGTPGPEGSSSGQAAGGAVSPGSAQ